MSNFFNRNLTAKIISIFIALIMWTYVMSEINPKMTREFTNVAVQILNVEELRQQGLVIVGEVNNNIRVTVKGRRDEIYKINKNEIRATADLRGYKVGNNNVPIELTPMGNVEVDFFSKFLKVELEEVIRRQKEVSLSISGSPRVGYILNEAQHKPTVVWIEGPASLVNAVERVVARLEIKEESEDIVASLPLKAVNDKGDEVLNVDIKPPYIDVYIPVDRLRTVKITPQVQATAAEGYKITGITLLPEQVALRGQEEIITNILTVETDTIVLENLRETQQRQIGLKLPEGITTFNGEAVEVRIEVEAIESRVLSISREGIIFVGARPGLQVDKTTLPELLEVKVVGVSGIVNKLEAKDIQLTVDLSNLNSGNHDIIMKIAVPGISEEQIDELTVIPKSLTIKLIENNN